MIDFVFDIDGIEEYRALLSAQISFLLNCFGSTATLSDVQSLILEHDGVTRPSESIAKLIALFNAGEDDLDTLLPIIQDAWNYFPHRSLDGRCPAELMADDAAARKNRRRKIISF